MTFEERKEAGDPFIELLAADTLSVAQKHGAVPETLVPRTRLLALAGAGVGCLAVLGWMIAAGPGYMGYGASLLWTGPKHDTPPMYAIRVLPGDIAVRRHSDQMITAEVIGLKNEKVRLFARFDSADSKPGAQAKQTDWEPVTMQVVPAQLMQARMSQTPDRHPARRCSRPRTARAFSSCLRGCRRASSTTWRRGR